MPKVGDKEFPYTPEGMAAAKAESKNMGMPMQDGATRSVQEYAGGGKTGYSKIGMYKEGGETDKEKTITDTKRKGLDISQDKKGRYVAKGKFDVPTEQVGGKGGGKRRMYEEDGKSTDMQLAMDTAQLAAERKMTASPEDSLVTSSKAPKANVKLKKPKLRKRKRRK